MEGRGVGQRGPHWVWPLAAAGLLLLAVGGLTYLSRSGAPWRATSPSTATPAVQTVEVAPWVNRPLPTYVPTVSTPPAYPTVAPPCQASQLRVSQGQTEAAAGTAYDYVVFTNVGAGACLLRGSPVVTGVGPAGVRGTVPLRRGYPYPLGLAPGDMRPGGQTLLAFAISHACGTAEQQRQVTVYRQLAFQLPAGGQISSDVSLSAGSCGLAISDFGRPPRPVPTPSPGSLGVLQAKLVLPAAARAGSTLRYVVTLSNATDQEVLFEPCPGYTESLGTSTTAGTWQVVEGSFTLNCDQVRSIPARGRVSYDMQMQVPADSGSGPAKVDWYVNTPDGPFAGGIVTISR